MFQPLWDAVLGWSDTAQDKLPFIWENHTLVWGAAVAGEPRGQDQWVVLCMVFCLFHTVSFWLNVGFYVIIDRMGWMSQHRIQGQKRPADKLVYRACVARPPAHPGPQRGNRGGAPARLVCRVCWGRAARGSQRPAACP